MKVERMEGDCGFTTDIVTGEFEFYDERTKSIDGSIEMVRGNINILEHFTRPGLERELKRLIEFREKYVKCRMRELLINDKT